MNLAVWGGLAQLSGNIHLVFVKAVKYFKTTNCFSLPNKWQWFRIPCQKLLLCLHEVVGWSELCARFFLCNNGSVHRCNSHSCSRKCLCFLFIFYEKYCRAEESFNIMQKIIDVPLSRWSDRTCWGGSKLTSFLKEHAHTYVVWWNLDNRFNSWAQLTLNLQKSKITIAVGLQIFIYWMAR